MKNQSPLPNRLKAGTPGAGAPSETEIEQRAIELARCDGRDAFTDGDLERAAAELGGLAEPANAPESDAVAEQITEWDAPLDQSGHRVETRSLEDEATIAEQLIEDGNEEADHDLRVAAEEDRGDES